MPESQPQPQSPHPIYLITSRNTPSQRSHFAIYIPSPSSSRPTTKPNPDQHIDSPSENENGTIIHAIGAPMAGYKLEFRRNHPPGPSLACEPFECVRIGVVGAEFVLEGGCGCGGCGATTGGGGGDGTRDFERRPSIDSTPRTAVEKVAAQVPVPGISENFLGPVNGTTNRRCQEWTIDFIRRLVQLGYIGADAVDIVQSKRDPPNHGVGLRPVGVGRT